MEWKHFDKQGESDTTILTKEYLAHCVYDNLALCYASELQKLEQLTGTTSKLQKLHIVGGGSNNRFLNQLISWFCMSRVWQTDKFDLQCCQLIQKDLISWIKIA